MNTRQQAASLVRELRRIRTPNLTIRERNQAIRSHLRYFLKHH